MSIDIERINKRFGDFVALDDVYLKIEEGGLTALLGPSGSGKTTLLRIIAGLERADSGRIRFFGNDMTDVHVSRRGVGFVFQHYALFKHMSVFDNVAYGLTVRPRPERPVKADIRKRVMRLLELVQLDWTADRLPAQLSGGQRQRIALARALAVEPRVLLLDEPFGALDAKVRTELRRWLRRLHDEIHVTSVFVTHDQEEAMEVADRIVVMNRGRIAQEGSVETLYEHPNTPFVFEFLGSTNVLPVEVRDGQALLPGQAEPLAVGVEHGDGGAELYVRPADLRIAQPGQPGVEVVVEEVQRTGPLVRAEARTAAGGQAVQVEIPHLHHDTHEFVAGAPLRLRLMQFSIYSSVNADERSQRGWQDSASRSRPDRVAG